VATGAQGLAAGYGDHQFGTDELLTRVSLPPPVPGERAAYVRAVSRTYAEWPLAEAVARLGTDGGADGVEGANPLPLTGYKAPLLTGVVTEALERTLR
jgi:xanthine dehydrogenase YagS FAD-binding subunit